jgi:integrase
MEFADKRDKRYPNRVHPEDLEAPLKDYKLYKDASLTGFGLRVTSTGVRAFVLDYVHLGRSRRYTIGQFPAWSVDAARTRASELKRSVDNGNDPQEEKQERYDEPDFKALYEEYQSRYMSKLRASSRRDYESVIRNHILTSPIGKKKLSDITHSDVVKLHHKVSKETPTQANRMIAILKRMFGIAVKWKMMPDNPAKGIELNEEKKDTVFLKADEVRRLMVALDDYAGKSSENKVVANAIKIIILTGARKNEVLSATWNQFDLEEGKWVKPSAHTKQKEEHHVPLSDAALAVLTDMDRESKAAAAEFQMQRSKWVFPGKGKTGHLVEIKKAWNAVKESAGLTEAAFGKHVKMHALRHTYASLLVAKNISLPKIGALLGHTQAQTTDRYAHLYDDPLREATELAAGAIAGKKQAADDMAAMMKKLRQQAAEIARERGVSVDQVISELMG